MVPIDIPPLNQGYNESFGFRPKKKRHPERCLDTSMPRMAPRYWGAVVNGTKHGCLSPRLVNITGLPGVQFHGHGGGLKIWVV